MVPWTQLREKCRSIDLPTTRPTPRNHTRPTRTTTTTSASSSTETISCTSPPPFTLPNIANICTAPTTSSTGWTKLQNEIVLAGTPSSHSASTSPPTSATPRLHPNVADHLNENAPDITMADMNVDPCTGGVEETG